MERVLPCLLKKRIEVSNFESCTSWYIYIYILFIALISSPSVLWLSYCVSVLWLGLSKLFSFVTSKPWVLFTLKLFEYTYHFCRTFLPSVRTSNPRVLLRQSHEFSLFEYTYHFCRTFLPSVRSSKPWEIVSQAVLWIFWLFLYFEITFVNNLVLQRYINYSYVLLLSYVRHNYLTN